MILQFQENGFYFTFDMTENQPVYLLHMGAEPMVEQPGEKVKGSCHFQEIQVTGEGRTNHMGVSPIGTLPGRRMHYTGYSDERNDLGRILKIHTKDTQTGLAGTMIYQFHDGIPVVRCRNIVTNEGNLDLGLEVVTSFVQPMAADGVNDDIHLLIPHNSWSEEIKWKENSLSQLGGSASTKRIQVRSIGSWSTGEYLPMACMRNLTKGTMQFWQIEHNGGWNWELQGSMKKLTLILTGPNETDHHWWKCLKPGETFETVPAAVGIVKGGIDETFAALTRYRRAIRRKKCR